MRISWRSRKHCCRYKKAKEQFDEKTKTLQEIFDYTKECLISLGLDTTKMKIIDDIKMFPPYDKNFYEKIKDSFSLDDERDIVWMKFTKKKGHIGVVATSNDINFDMPQDLCDYDKKKDNGKWLYNFSGVLVKYLEEEWNEEYVFVFPLAKQTNHPYTRHMVEKEIGNYLIDKGVPILDYYSHRI